MNYRHWQLANRITNIVAAKTPPTSFQGTCHGTHGGGDSASSGQQSVSQQSCSPTADGARILGNFAKLVKGL